jgi:hypothetical protein
VAIPLLEGRALSRPLFWKDELFWRDALRRVRLFRLIVQPQNWSRRSVTLHGVVNCFGGTRSVASVGEGI